MSLERRQTREEPAKKQPHEYQGVGPSLQEKLAEMREKVSEDLEDKGLIESSEGGLQKVFTAMATRAEHVRQGIEDDIRVAVFYLEGGSAGASGCGVGMALQDSDLLEGASIVVGSSVGAHNSAGHVTHQMSRASRTFRTLSSDTEFYDPMRGTRGLANPIIRAVGIEPKPRHIIDVGHPLRMYRGEIGSPRNVEGELTGRGAFDLTWDTKHQTLIFGVTDAKTGEPILVYPKPGNDLLEKIKASTAMPFPVYGKVEMEGRSVSDGAIADPLPIKAICEELEKTNQRPTHILVVSNWPPGYSSERDFKHWIAEKIMQVGFSKKLRAAYAQKAEKYRKNREYLEESGIPYAFISSATHLATIETDVAKVKDATLSMFLMTKNTLDKYVPVKEKIKEVA